jgi:hypothetical protein
MVHQSILAGGVGAVVEIVIAIPGIVIGPDKVVFVRRGKYKRGKDKKYHRHNEKPF